MSELSDILDSLRDSEPQDTREWFRVPPGADVVLTLNPFQTIQLVTHLRVHLSSYEKFEFSEIKRALEEVLAMLERELKK